MDNNTPQIPHPQLCRLSLMIGERGIDVTVTSQVEDNSMVWRHLEYDAADSDRLKAIENLVYANTWLLGDYAKVDVLVDTDHVVLLPPDEACRGDFETVDEIFEQLYPDERLTVSVRRLGHGDGAPSAAVGIDSDLAAFINRTFNNPGITAPIVPLAVYFGLKRHLGNSGKLHVHVVPGSVSVIAYAGGRMLMANTFSINTPVDALYYVLAAARWLNFDTEVDSMSVSGDAALRDSLMPLLRRYVTSAMPHIFPAALFKAGKDAMSAPFPLVVLPLID